MNFRILKLNLALKVEASLKPTTKSSTNEKKFYKDWEYSNSYCLKIMENLWRNLFMQAFPRLRMQRSSCMSLVKKYTKFSKNEKNELCDNHWMNVCFESNIIASDT